MSNFYDTIWELHKDWTYTNPCILYGLIRSLRPKSAVEVGTYRGLGASWMARAIQENNFGHLFCIDNFTLLDHESTCGPAREYLESNLIKSGVRDWITILDGNSNEVKWPESVDFAYIDGWHGYEAVRHDFDKCDSLRSFF